MSTRIVPASGITNNAPPKIPSRAPDRASRAKAARQQERLEAPEPAGDRVSASHPDSHFLDTKSGRAQLENLRRSVDAGGHPKPAANGNQPAKAPAGAAVGAILRSGRAVQRCAGPLS